MKILEVKTFNRFKLKQYMVFIITLCVLLGTLSIGYVSAKELNKEIKISFINTQSTLRSKKNENINVRLENTSSESRKFKLIIDLYDNKDNCINSISFNHIVDSKSSLEFKSYMTIVPEASRIKAYVVDSEDSSKKLSNEIKLYTSNLGISSRTEKVINIEDIEEEINKEEEYTLPETVASLTNKGKIINVPVIWKGEVNSSKPGIFTYEGMVPLINKSVKLTLTINSDTSTKDDEVISFPDKNLQNAIRKAIDKPEGDIYKGDVKNLKELTPINYGISYIQDLTGIENLVSLEVLNIDYMYVSDLSPLKNLKNLKWLYASNNPIKILKANTFKNMKNLEQLGLEGCGIETIEKGAFNGLNKLHYLDFTLNGLSDVEEIGKISTLTSLHLDSNRITNLKPLSSLTNLELLWIENNGIKDITPLAKLTNLQRLKLNHNNITSLSPLKNLNKLRKLQINKNKLSNLNGLEGMKDLVELCANENGLTDVKALKDLRNLENLEIKNTGMLKDISSFSGLVNLTHLDITNNKIEDISSLKDLTKLEYLWMENNGVTDIKPLSNLVKLKLLKLRGNKIKDYSPTEKYYYNLKTKDFTLN